METYKFRTNLKCGGCVATVAPFLDALEGIEKWSVDLSVPERLLTVEVEGIEPAGVTKVIGDAGYQAEQI